MINEDREWELANLSEKAREKFGSYISDLEESVASEDWKQVKKDVDALRRHYETTRAAKQALAAT